MSVSEPAGMWRLARWDDPNAFFLSNRITRLIERGAPVLFALVALLYIVSFNGKWRIGLNSANYRGLADAIATGHGYHFGNWAGMYIYPGFPLLLAGLQKIFGRSDLAPVSACVLMLVMSILTLLVTWRLIRLHYPKWVAVTVTFGTAINAWYVQQTSDLMTDIPFLLGVVTALYGWDLLRTPGRTKWLAVALLTSGLFFAGSMRPTFLVLVAAWGMTCLAGIAFRLAPSRKFYMISLGVMIAVWIVIVALDPRSRGFKPFAGGYESEAIADLPGGDTSRVARAVHVLNKQLPAGFFGEQLSLGSIHFHKEKIAPSSIILSLALIASVGLLARRHLLWALLAWGTIATTVLTSDEPRYYLMVLPILLLAWLRMLLNLASLFRGYWSEMILAGGLALVTLNNISALVTFVREQRASDFLVTYHDGKLLPVIQLSKLVREKVPTGGTVLGPSGSIVSFLSGRHVITQRELLPRHGHVAEYPQRIEHEHIAFAVFPAPLYRDKEPAIARLMDRGVLREFGRVGEVHGMRLARLRVVIPPGDWTKMKKVYAQDLPRPTTRPTTRHHPATTKPKHPATRKRKPTTRRTARPTTTPTTRDA